MQLVRARNQPDNRFLHIDYHLKDGYEYKKVSKLSAPLGVDAEPKTFYRFSYKDRQTDATDAYGNRSVYNWDENGRLTSIAHYPSGRVSCYRTERMSWSAAGNPISYSIGDDRGYKALKRFTYDRKGWEVCVIAEEFIGNLTGKEGSHLAKYTPWEVRRKTYSYTPSRHVETETFGDREGLYRQRISYTYYENTSLVKLKTISDPTGVKERYYYEYAPNGEAVLEITDDGTSSSIEDLTGVTQRYIKHIKHTPYGLPCEETHCCLDLKTGEEKQLSRIVNHYSARRLVTKKDYYDAEDNYVYSKSWSYNSFDLVTREEDQIGRVTTYEYDANCNRTRKSMPHLEYQILYTYDFSNRLIKEEEQHDDGRSFATSYAYDLKGNKIKEVDRFGNETLFQYDGHDRLIAKTLPAVEDAEGNFSESVEQYTYDLLNHLTSRTDCVGRVTRLHCTAYGKPSTLR